MNALQIARPVDEQGQFILDDQENPTSLSVSATRIGIGTTDPKTQLEVVSPLPTGDANSGQVAILDDRGRTLLLGRAPEYAFVQSHNKHPLSLNPIGNNVGIGTTDPKTRLEVVSPLPTGDANSGQVAILDDRGRTLLLGRAPEYAFVQSHNKHPLSLNPIGNNVGIGTTDPAYTLDVAGSIRVADDIVLAGADGAEEFEILGESPDLGTVLVIDGPGRLRVSKSAYDTSVAGVVSGAGSLRPGIVFGRRDDGSDRVPVALFGTVYCKVDARTRPIGVGDLLTTANEPGHAMSLRRRRRRPGTVLGKAMQSCPRGLGLIPILVGLQ